MLGILMFSCLIVICCIKCSNNNKSAICWKIFPKLLLQKLKINIHF